MMPPRINEKAVLNELIVANESTVRDILTVNKEIDKVKEELESAKKSYESAVQAYKVRAASHQLCKEAVLRRVSEEKEKLSSESDFIGEKFEQRVENMDALCKEYNDLRRRYYRLKLALESTKT